MPSVLWGPGARAVRALAALTVVAGLLPACARETAVNRILRPPAVTITAPEPDARLRKGSPAAFVGEVVDSYDTAEDMTVAWVLDGEAELAPTLEGDVVSLELDLEPLALGPHLMQLRAIDTDGMEGLVGVPFVVDGAISAPTVTILAPASGSLFAPGEEITFRGAAEDNNTDPDDLEFVWSSSLDGELEGDISGDGQSVLFEDTLSIGTHEIALDATDRDGEIGRDTIVVSVGEVVEPAQRGDVVFSELMINPQVVADELGEWVELYNTASYAIDVGGYTFRDDGNDNYTLEGPLVVAPGDYLVLCANMDRNVNGGVPCDGRFRRESAGALALGNDTDEVILETPGGVVIDEVVYASTWFRRGVAIGVDPDALGADNNDTEADWCDQTTVISTGGEPGTPGRTNDPC